MKFALLHAYFHYRMGGTIYRNGGSVPTESRYHRAGQAVQLGPEYSIIAEIVGYGCTNDAFHITAPPEGGAWTLGTFLFCQVL